MTHRLRLRDVGRRWFSASDRRIAVVGVRCCGAVGTPVLSDQPGQGQRILISFCHIVAAHFVRQLVGLIVELINDHHIVSFQIASQQNLRFASESEVSASWLAWNSAECIRRGKRISLLLVSHSQRTTKQTHFLKQSMHQFQLATIDPK